MQEAAQTTLNLLDTAVARSSSLQNQYHQLARSPNQVATEAASFAIFHNRLQKAVEFVEQGRALIYAQLSRYRVVLGTLREEYPDLESRFASISKELDEIVVRNPQGGIASVTEDPATRFAIVISIPIIF